MFKVVADYLKEKANSTIIVSFILFYILCNCRWIFTSLFTDQNLIYEKTGLLKNEYIYQHFQELHPDNPWFWLCNLAPFLLTYLYVWWVPKFIINPAYKKQAQYANERRRCKIDLENELLSKERVAIDKESKNTEKRIELENKKKELQEANPEREFDNEFNSFVLSDVNVHALNALKNTVYQNNGYINNVNPTYYMIWDVNGLAEQSGAGSALVAITEKGRAFLRRLSTDTTGETQKSKKGAAV